MRSFDDLVMSDFCLSPLDKWVCLLRASGLWNVSQHAGIWTSWDTVASCQASNHQAVRVLFWHQLISRHLASCHDVLFAYSRRMDAARKEKRRLLEEDQLQQPFQEHLVTQSTHAYPLQQRQYVQPVLEPPFRTPAEQRLDVLFQQHQQLLLAQQQMQQQQQLQKQHAAQQLPSSLHIGVLPVGLSLLEQQQQNLEQQKKFEMLRNTWLVQQQILQQQQQQRSLAQ